MSVFACWPLRPLPDGREPQITSGHSVRNPDRPRHWGVDLFYRWCTADGAVKIGDGGATRGKDGKPKWFIPDRCEAIAVNKGKVARSGKSKTGYYCWLEIAPNLFAGYFHLSSLLVTANDHVVAGQVIGIVGDNPVDSDARHLHFELHSGDTKNHPRGTIDPQRELLKTPRI